MRNATLEVGNETFNVTYFMMSEQIGTIAAGDRETQLHIVVAHSGQPAILHRADDSPMPIHLMRGCEDQMQGSKLLHRMSFARRPG